MKVIILAVVMLLFGSYVAYGRTIEVSQINPKTWVAEDTKFFQMTDDEKVASLGYMGFEENILPLYRLSDKEIPAKVSLQPYMSVIKNQGKCGSCVNFAVTGAMELGVNKVLGQRIYNLDFSEQELMSCGGGSCSGWQIIPALMHVWSEGVSDETCFEYQAKNTECKDTCSWSKEVRIKVKDFWQIPFSQIQKAIAAGYSVITSMAVYEDFYAYKEGVYKHITGKLLGYHAIVIIGYDKTDHSLLVRNSWGPDFGEKGYFRIYENDISIGNAGFIVSLK